MKLTDQTRKELLNSVVEEFKRLAEADLFDPERINGQADDFTEEQAKELLASMDLEKTREGFWEDMEYFRNN